VPCGNTVGLHVVTYHPTRVNASRLNPSQQLKTFICLGFLTLCVIDYERFQSAVLCTSKYAVMHSSRFIMLTGALYISDMMWYDIIISRPVLDLHTAKGWELSWSGWLEGYMSRWFTCLLLSARLSHRNSVCPSVRPSHKWIRQKRRKLGSPSLHRRCMEDSSFRNRKAFPYIRKGSPQTRALNERRWKKLAILANKSLYLSNCAR